SKYSLPVNLPLGQGRVFAGQPDRGDMVIFKHPIDETDYIKRVIALPGDTISVLGGQVVLNGKLLDRVAIDDFVQPVDQLMLDAQQDLRDRGFAAESPCASVKFEEVSDAGVRQCRYPRFRETLPSGRTYEVLDFGLQMSGDSMDEVTIPEGKMFVMGDNRDNSQDSRFEARSEGAVGIVSQDALVGEATIIMWSTDGSAEWIKPWTWFSAARWGRIGSIL
ncbi:MAG: signal peptidase I, partial [Pseudomonadota bacterium]